MDINLLPIHFSNRDNYFLGKSVYVPINGNSCSKADPYSKFFMLILSEALSYNFQLHPKNTINVHLTILGLKRHKR